MSTMNEAKSGIELHQARIDSKRTKKIIGAFLVDWFLWSYTLLTSYKIIYQKLILDLRYPEFSWSQPSYAVGIGLIIASILFMSKYTIGRGSFGLLKRNETNSILRAPFFIMIFLVLILTFVTGIFVSQVSITEFLSESGLSGARRIFIALFKPNFAILDQALFAAVETIYMAFIATVVALPLAFVIAFFAARNLMKGSPYTMAVYTIVRFFLNLSRSIEPLVWAIIFSVWVGIGPFAGMLALCLHSISSLSKLYSEQIENISDGPIEAITATGANPIQVIWYGVVPQVVLPYLSFTIYRWDINVRMATVIGLVGGGGIGTLLMQYQGLAKWNEVGLLVMIIASIVWLMDYSSSKIREAIK